MNTKHPHDIIDITENLRYQIKDPTQSVPGDEVVVEGQTYVRLSDDDAEKLRGMNARERGRWLTNQLQSK